MVIQLPAVGETTTIVFRLPTSIWADTVHLVGDFNGWSTSATPMRCSEQYWEVTVVLTTGSTYAYAYLLDGIDWCSEHSCVERAVGATPPITLHPAPIAHAQRMAMAEHYR